MRLSQAQMRAATRVRAMALSSQTGSMVSGGVCGSVRRDEGELREAVGLAEGMERYSSSSPV